MFKYLNSNTVKKLVSLVVTTSVSTAYVLTPSLSEAQNISTLTSTRAGSVLSIEHQLIVASVIPNTSAHDMDEEVVAEVRAQETLEKEIIAEMEEQVRLQAIEEYRKYVNSIVCDPMDVSRVSGLKESDFKLLTKGTWWEGNESALIALERVYGVNAMFAMAVSTLESGFGTSDRATLRNNYYGLELPNVWTSLYDNTQYWGDVISRYYVDEGRKSVSSISTKYCPPNSESWAQINTWKMVDLYNKLINRLNDTTI